MKPYLPLVMVLEYENKKFLIEQYQGHLSKEHHVDISLLEDKEVVRRGIPICNVVNVRLLQWIFDSGVCVIWRLLSCT